MSTLTGPTSDPLLDDLLSDEAVNRPRTFFRRLRETDSVYWNARWRGWILTSYEDVLAGFRNHEVLSSDRFAGPFAEDIVERRSEYEQLIAFMNKWMFTSDRPAHTHLRSLINTAFTPRSVEVLRPRVQQLVKDLTDSVRDQDTVNFMSEFAFTLPVVVIAEYLGVPAEARQDVRRWSDDLGAVVFVQGGNENRFDTGAAAMENLIALIRPIVRDRRHRPQDDLISAMVHADIGGDRFTEDEIISNAVLMVFAGHETTMNLLSNGVVAFNEFPSQWDRLLENDRMPRTAAEEILRYDGPIKALARWAKEPIEIGGKTITGNDRVLLVQHGANMDPEAFADPEKFDIGRWPNKHLGFGQGIHTCLGAPLARMEMQEALAHLAKEFSSIEVMDEKMDYNKTLVSRSLKGLTVKMHPR